MNTPLYLSRDEVREVDQRAIQELGLPGVVLMENAGRGATDRLEELGIAGPVVVCAGKGNNGGDGFVIARHLAIRGHSVRVLIFARREEFQGDAKVQLNVLERAGFELKWISTPDDDQLPKERTVFAESVEPILKADNATNPFPAEQVTLHLANADWIVDALLGTGARGEVREPMRSIIDLINASGRKVFAVDLPSGLDCDTGLPLGIAVRANHTVTFVARKLGFSNPQSRSYTGSVHVADIGVTTAFFRGL